MSLYVLVVLLLVGTLPLFVKQVQAADLLSLDFESELQGWTPLASSQEHTLRFERESSTVYQGSYALNFTSYLPLGENEGTSVTWLYNITSTRPAFPLNTGSELTVAWNVPKGDADYIGLYVQFTNGKDLYYASSSGGHYTNSSTAALLTLSEPASNWLTRQRNVYDDYAQAWGQPDPSVAIVGLGVYHVYPSGRSGSQASYYDSILLFSPTPEFTISSSPASAAVVRGGSQKCAIALGSANGFTGPVALSVTGVPPNATGQLSQGQVYVSPSQNASSTLTLVTTDTTPLGSYSIVVTGTSDALVKSVTVTLAIARPSLLVTVTTDKLVYSQNESVNVTGRVRALSGEPTSNASVHLEAIDQDGNTVHTAEVQSDLIGNFQDDFTLSPDAAKGTYTIYALASRTGYEDSFDSVDIVVGQTNAPAIVITILRVTDLQNNTKTQFRRGETAMVWVKVVNAGAALNQSMIWFTVDDPEGVSAMVFVEVGPLGANQTIVKGYSFQVGMTASLGVYHVTILATDNFIYLGGSIVDSAESSFIVAP